MKKLLIFLTLLFSSLFLIVQPVLADAASSCAAAGGAIVNDECQISVSPPPSSIKSLGSLVSAGITAVIAVAGLLTFVYLVWGGIEWLTSGGDKAKYEAARDRITAAVIGLAIIAAAWAVMQLVAYFFGVDIVNLSFPSAATTNSSSEGVIGM